MKARFFIFSAIAIAACSPLEPDEVISDLQKDGAEDGFYTLTVEATKGFDTKALSLDDNTLNASWVTGEKVGVYVNGVRCGQLSATADGSDATKATLSGTLTDASGIKADATIMLLYPDREDITEGTKWDYTGQNGAAPGSDLSKYDFATATLTVSSINGTTVNTTTSSVAFQNEQSVYRFGFKVGGAGSAIEVKEFTVTSSQNQLVRTRSYVTDAWTSAFGSLTVTSSAAPAGNIYYMSLRNDNTSADDTYTFYAIGSNDALYSGTKAITAANLGNGKFISMQSISVSQPSFASVPNTEISLPENVY